MTEEEKAIIDSAESIVNEARDNEKKEVNAYMKDLCAKIDNSLWASNDMKDRTYDVCSLREQFRGTPESLEEYRKFRNITDPDAESIVFSHKDNQPNLCLGLFENFISGPEMPPSIIELFHNFAALIHLHEDEKGKLVGLIARTKGTGTLLDENEDEVQKTDVIITSIMLGNFYYNSVRKENGELVAEHQPDIINIAAYTGPDDKDDVVACAEYIGEKFGKMAFAHYTALYMPLVMKDADPELYESMKQDALSSSGDEETTNPKEQ